MHILVHTGNMRLDDIGIFFPGMQSEFLETEISEDEVHVKLWDPVFLRA